MSSSTYWLSLKPRQRAGLLLGAAAIAVALAAAAFWLFRDPYVTIASGLSGERLSSLRQQLDREKIPYRFTPDGSAIEVEHSRAGKARALATDGAAAGAVSVGLELFKESDFSATDFAQKVNYQRALQGELTRTIQTLSGVRSARVHVILPESGLLKRTVSKATAAIGVTMMPSQVLSQAQVRGIQKLVAASVPDIKLDDIVVFDDSGATLTRSGSAEEAYVPSSQLDLKRQVDAYLEGKVAKLLRRIAPDGAISLSVDATLDDKQLRVTTEEPIAAPGSKDSERPAGVLARERQTQRIPAGGVQTAGDAAVADVSDLDYEYKVGHRVEQAVTTPGSIKRMSVAVIVRASELDVDAATIERLVAHAVGVDKTRGDAVSVVLIGKPERALPALAEYAPESIELVSATAPAVSNEQPLVFTSRYDEKVLPLLGTLTAALLSLWLLYRFYLRRRQPTEPPVDVEAVTLKVRQWLDAEHPHAR